MHLDGEDEIGVVLTTGPQGFYFMDLDGNFVRELEPKDLNQDLWEAMNALVGHVHAVLETNGCEGLLHAPSK